MEEQLRQSEKMPGIGQLAGGVAHDFNNQLTGILNYAILAKEEVDRDSTTASYLDEILSSAKRSAELTKHLLAFARKGKYSVQQVDMNKVIEETVSMLRRSLDKKITITTQLRANPSTIAGDDSQLQSAVLNIALNSRDAMPEGGEIILSTELKTLDESYFRARSLDLSPGDYLSIGVTDNGLGMSAEVVKRIFEPFFTTKEAGKGLGMGMASVYGTVTNHGGVVEVESHPGEGTTVSLLLPAIDKVETLENGKKEIGPKGVGRRLLIVDDEEKVATSLKLLLKSKGYEAITCGDGREAVSLFKSSWREFDLVLLDMIMPRMNGEEVFLALKEIHPEVKVLLLSGFSLSEVAKKTLDEGALGFVQKPVVLEDLVGKLNEILEKETN
jgi:CheY-like chemotaxis protein